MPSRPQISNQLQTLLTTVAEEAVRTTSRELQVRAFTGPALVQTLVFDCVSTPTPSLTNLTQTAAALGVTISPQGLVGP
ncbi:MAG: hypothetical protein ACR2LS_01160 [Thermomicrobiales bacterium]